MSRNTRRTAKNRARIPGWFDANTVAGVLVLPTLVAFSVARDLGVTDKQVLGVAGDCLIAYLGATLVWGAAAAAIPVNRLVAVLSCVSGCALGLATTQDFEGFRWCLIAAAACSPPSALFLAAANSVGDEDAVLTRGELRVRGLLFGSAQLVVFVALRVVDMSLGGDDWLWPYLLQTVLAVGVGIASWFVLPKEPIQLLHRAATAAESARGHAGERWGLRVFLALSAGGLVAAANAHPGLLAPTLLTKQGIEPAVLGWAMAIPIVVSAVVLARTAHAAGRHERRGVPAHRRSMADPLAPLIPGLAAAGMGLIVVIGNVSGIGASPWMLGAALVGSATMAETANNLAFVWANAAIGERHQGTAAILLVLIRTGGTLLGAKMALHRYDSGRADDDTSGLSALGWQGFGLCALAIALVVVFLLLRRSYRGRHRAVSAPSVMRHRRGRSRRGTEWHLDIPGARIRLGEVMT